MHTHLQNHNSPKGLFERLEQRTKELNAFLVVLAIGLLALDATCFTLLKLTARYRGFLVP